MAWINVYEEDKENIDRDDKVKNDREGNEIDIVDDSIKYLINTFR